LRQEDCEFEARLGYVKTLSPKKQKRKEKRREERKGERGGQRKGGREERGEKEKKRKGKKENKTKERKKKCKGIVAQVVTRLFLRSGAQFLDMSIGDYDIHDGINLECYYQQSRVPSSCPTFLSHSHFSY
jgi:hypothetical protein